MVLLCRYYWYVSSGINCHLPCENSSRLEKWMKTLPSYYTPCTIVPSNKTLRAINKIYLHQVQLNNGKGRVQKKNSLKSLRLRKLLDQSDSSYWALLGPSGSLRVLLGHSGSFWALVSLTGPYWALLGPTGRYWALLGVTGPYWPLLGLTGLYWTLLGLTEPYWALLGLVGPYFAFAHWLTNWLTN